SDGDHKLPLPRAPVVGELRGGFEGITRLSCRFRLAGWSRSPGCSEPVLNRYLAYPAERIDHFNSHRNLDLLAFAVSCAPACGNNPAIEEPGHLVGRHEKLDLGAAQTRNRHANDRTRSVNHRPSRVARMETPVDLDLVQR